MRLLVRREHSTEELREKLLVRGHAPQAVAQAIEWLRARHYLDDLRFAQEYVHARTRRGMGPLRLIAELRRRGLDDEIIEKLVRVQDERWNERARELCRRRYGGRAAATPAERARRIRFMRQRGFTQQQVRAACGRSTTADD